MKPSDTTLIEVDISKDIYLQYDEEDTWIGIVDNDSRAVIMGIEEVKLLLPKLKELIEKIESHE